MTLVFNATRLELQAGPVLALLLFLLGVIPFYYFFVLFLLTDTNAFNHTRSARGFVDHRIFRLQTSTSISSARCARISVDAYPRLHTLYVLVRPVDGACSVVSSTGWIDISPLANFFGKGAAIGQGVHPFIAAQLAKSAPHTLPRSTLNTPGSLAQKGSVTLCTSLYSILIPKNLSERGSLTLYGPYSCLSVVRPGR